MNDTKQILKDWGFLKTKQEYDFFHTLARLTMLQKTELMGEGFMNEYVKIQTHESEQAFLDYLAEMKDYKMRITLADTYATIMLVSPIFFQKK